MNRLLQFWQSTWGHAALAAAVLTVGAIVALNHRKETRAAASLPAAPTAAVATTPKVYTREMRRLELPAAPTRTETSAPTMRTAAPVEAITVPRPAPLQLFAAAAKSPVVINPSAPFGRLIPCRTVIALESNRLDTPVIGLVAEDVWHAGQLIIPAGAEVHGRAALDRTRERIAATGQWTIVWRTRDRDNGRELRVEGLALDRADDAADEEAMVHDGSAGLRGQIVRSGDARELKLFAAAFLASAAAAMQETRGAAGPFGEMSLPTASARNGALSGISAVLREQVEQMREAIARDGLYVHVPPGKAFYLYVTQTLDQSAGANPLPK
jgi:hypothetical protein